MENNKERNNAFPAIQDVKCVFKMKTAKFVLKKVILKMEINVKNVKKIA